MTRRLPALAGLLLALLGPLGAGGATAAPAETVIGVELVSPHRLPEPVIRLAIGDLQGRPLSRRAVRDSLERLWALGLFAGIHVEEVREPGGVRLRYRLDRLPHVRAVAWHGDLGLEKADLAVATALAVGEAATPERLGRARDNLLALYRREGFFAAQIEVDAREVPESHARDVTFVMRAGERARVGWIDLVGVDRVPIAILERALGMRAGDRYREARIRDGLRALEQRLLELGFLEARVNLGEPAWDRGRNRLDLRIEVEEGRWTRVVFEGNAAMKDAILRERLTFRPRSAPAPSSSRSRIVNEATTSSRSGASPPRTGRSA
jgi:outer membrane protein assembly factor BamA